jgi:hypothetical protein
MLLAYTEIWDKNKHGCTEVQIINLEIDIEETILIIIFHNYIMNIVKYLNIYDYKYEETFMENYLIEKNYSYIWKNTSTLAIFYKIKTIDGMKLLPIITFNKILEKENINIEIIKSFNERKFRISSEKILNIFFKSLPYEIIKLIVTYSNITFFLFL